MIRIIGAPFFDTPVSGQGGCATRIATVFPEAGIIVTLPGIHATQRSAYADELNRERASQGKRPLNDQERLDVFLKAVDLLVDGHDVLIRPDPGQMELAFAADGMLQQLVPRNRIKFLFVDDPGVRRAIIRRGEAWRIRPLPRSNEEMCRLIGNSPVAVRGEPIYFYCAVRGTRILTFARFAGLAKLPLEKLRLHLEEIGELANSGNAQGWPELELFVTDGKIRAADLIPAGLKNMDQLSVLQVFEDACRRMEHSTPIQFRTDDVKNSIWRNRMYRRLIAPSDSSLTDEELSELGEEYYMQIHWLPGARIDNGLLIFDSISENSPEKDPVSHELICNLIREYDGIEFINIGHVERSLSRRVPTGGRRSVYVTHFRSRNSSQDELHIVRFQKWGVRERLDEGKSMLQAMRESEEYTDYILDRRLACRQLGMKLVARLWVRKVQEQYAGIQQSLVGQTIWSPYIERDYIAGIATDKISRARLKDPGYALQLAIGLGQAAAINLIVGRANLAGEVVFDDGDEMLIEDDKGGLVEIVVADPTGAFTNFGNDLSQDAPAYAEPIRRRMELVPDGSAFKDAYVAAFIDRFQATQQSYRIHRQTFDTLFSHRRCDPAGNLAHRWTMVLDRMRHSDASCLAKIIRENV